MTAAVPVQIESGVSGCWLGHSWALFEHQLLGHALLPFWGSMFIMVWFRSHANTQVCFLLASSHTSMTASHALADQQEQTSTHLYSSVALSGADLLCTIHAGLPLHLLHAPTQPQPSPAQHRTALRRCSALHCRSSNSFQHIVQQSLCTVSQGSVVCWAHDRPPSGLQREWLLHASSRTSLGQVAKGGGVPIRVTKGEIAL